MPPKKVAPKKVEEKREAEKEVVLPEGQRTYFVGGWSTLDSLANAAAKITPGDRIVLLPGEHDIDGTILTSQELDIKGYMSPVLKGTLTFTSAGTGEKIDPKSWSKGSLKNVTFEGGSVIVQRAHLTIEGCTFSGGQRQLVIQHYCTPLVKGNKFTGASHASIACFPLSAPTLEGNEVSNGEGPNDVGILLQDSLANVAKNTLSNLTTGILVTGAKNKPTIVENKIKNVTGTGLFLLGGTSASVKKNVMEGCGYYGLQVDGGATSEVLANTIDGKVRIAKGSHPTLRANTITRQFLDLNEERAVPFESVY